MKNKDLFEIIANRISNHRTEVDADAQWKSFVRMQETETRRRSLVWLWGCVPLLLGAVVCVCGLLFQNENLELAEQNEISSEKQIRSIVDSETIDAEEAGTNNSTAENAVTLVSSKKAKEAKAQGSFKGINKQEKGIHKTESPGFLDIAPPELLGSEEKQEEKIAGIKSKSPDFEEKKEPSKPIFFDEVLLLIPIGPLALLKEKDRILEREIQFKPTEEFENKIKKSPSLILSAGVFSLRQKFIPKSDDYLDLAALREQQELGLIGWKLNLRAEFQLQKRWILSPEISYSERVERIDHEYEQETEYELENVPVAVFLNNYSGESTVIRADTTITGTQSVNIRKYNKYRQVDLGLSGGYRVLNKGKFSLIGLAGLRFNVWNGANGLSFDAEEPTGELSEIDFYRKTFGLAVSTGLQLQYQLTKQIGLQIRPVISRNISPVYKSDYGLNAVLTDYNLTVGLRYEL